MRVVVQQRSQLLRYGLAALLGQADGVAVVGTVVRVEELVEVCERARPHAVVVDIDGGGTDPWPPLAVLRQRCPAPTVVALHGPRPGVDLERARRAGFTTIGRQEGIGAVLRALRAEQSNPSTGTACSAPAGSRPALTRREASVLSLVAGGRTSREISLVLRVSHKTVENHKQRMFVKLGVQNQAHAVAVAIRQGMIAPYPAAGVAAHR
ncbi:MAG TPA: LuxR C-terminal-related transcriptional regulator [Egibacteraceae bacterium]|nr:LuxR C-terminal-related transcriptional regulator [Egibacteraceae bacterium]